MRERVFRKRAHGRSIPWWSSAEADPQGKGDRALKRDVANPSRACGRPGGRKPPLDREDEREMGQVNPAAVIR